MRPPSVLAAVNLEALANLFDVLGLPSFTVALLSKLPELRMSEFADYPTDDELASSTAEDIDGAKQQEAPRVRSLQGMTCCSSGRRTQDLLCLRHPDNKVVVAPAIGTQTWGRGPYVNISRSPALLF
ncbi:MAG: hypothetical protein DWQ37_15375 [Planctomycetota bacterium]|nr:MAG: hypothetical protein DWQ37_15375 [Planctomycetota bacterium]